MRNATLVNHGYFWADFASRKVFRPGADCCFGRKPVRFGKSPQTFPWVPRNVWSGVSGTYLGNLPSESGVRFGLAPWNGELSPSVPETPDPSKLPSRPGTRNIVQNRTPRPIWAREAKTRGPGHIRSQMKYQWHFVFKWRLLKLICFCFLFCSLEKKCIGLISGSISHHIGKMDLITEWCRRRNGCL